MKVKKRNGRLEDFNVEKINKCAERACEGLENVSASQVLDDRDRDETPLSASFTQYAFDIPVVDVDQIAQSGKCICDIVGLLSNYLDPKIIPVLS